MVYEFLMCAKKKVWKLKLYFIIIIHQGMLTAQFPLTLSLLVISLGKEGVQCLKLMEVSFCWLVNTGVSMCGSP